MIFTFTDHTVGAVKNETLVFVNFSAQDASISKISVPIIKRRSWGFQNTPNLQNLDYFEPSYGNLKKKKNCQKLVWLIDLEGHTVFCCFLSQNSFKLCKLGVFWNPQDLLLMMGTEILKIDAEMAEKIEVEVGNPLLKSDRKTEKWFLCWKCPFQLQLSQPILEQLSKSQCPSSRGDPEDSKTPPTCKVWTKFGW